MPRKLLLINVLLIALAAGGGLFIARELMAPMPMPQASKPRPPAPEAEQSQDPARPPFSSAAGIASKNLFSPTRTEAPPPPPVAATANIPKPNLFGVVLREGSPIAYLEDPTTKRVAGYRVGDSVAGGTVQAIGSDSVSIQRPDGKMDIRLRDPGKPRPAATAAAGAPGAQPVGIQPALPGVIPPAMPPTGVAPQPVPGQPGVIPQPGQATVPALPGRRPLPPNLLRRLPQAPPADAPQQ